MGLFWLFAEGEIVAQLKVEPRRFEKIEVEQPVPELKDGAYIAHPFSLIIIKDGKFIGFVENLYDYFGREIDLSKL